MLLPVKGILAEPPKDPIYLKTSNGWNAAYAHGNEDVEFRVIRNGAKLQDPYHILLQKDVGMMVSFVDKKELQNDTDLLAAHAQWEIDYWHQHASRVESNAREDLTGTRKDVKVTEIRVYRRQRRTAVILFDGTCCERWGFCPFSFLTSKEECRSVGKGIGQLVQTCSSKPGCRRNEAAVIGSQDATLNLRLR